MRTEQDMIAKIDKVCNEFTGNGQDLVLIVGMVVVGRRFGWKVIRLIMTRRLWVLACAEFGDLKDLLLERGDLAHKSVGLGIVDGLGRFWEVIRGQERLDSDKRKKIIR